MNMISTGAFLPETDASTKQNELVKKLTSAWEKKNSKTARAGGASLMALSLAACGGEDNTPFSAADVSAAETAAAAAATTAALTGADGTVYASVDAAVTSNDTAIADAARAEGVASVDITTDNQAAIDAAVAAVDLTTDNAAATDAAVAADTAFASLADLVAAYNDLASPTAASLTTTTAAQNLSTSMTNSSDTVTAATGTVGAGDVIADPSATDNDTMTIAHSGATLASTGVISNVENITINAASTTTFTITDASGVTGGAITVNLTTPGGATQATISDIGSNTTVTAGDRVATLIVDTGADRSDLTVVGGTGATTVNGSANKLTTATIDASAGTNVDVELGAESSDITITAGSGTVDINDNGGVETTNLTLNAATATTVTADFADDSSNINLTTGTGAVAIGAVNAGVAQAGVNTGMVIDASASEAAVAVNVLDGSDVTLTVGTDSTGITVDSTSVSETTDDGTTLTITADAADIGAGITDIDTVNLTMNGTASTVTLDDEVAAFTASATAAAQTLDITAIDNLGTAGGTLSGSQIITMTATTDNVDGAVLSSDGAVTHVLNLSTIQTADVDLSSVDTDIRIELGTAMAVGGTGTFTLANGATIASEAANTTNTTYTASTAVAGVTLDLTDAANSADFIFTNIGTVTVTAEADNTTATTVTVDSDTAGTQGAILITGSKDIVLHGDTDASSVTSSGFTGDLTATLSATVDTITSGSGDDGFTAYNGDFTVNAGAGDDTLTIGSIDLSDDTVSISGVEVIAVGTADAVLLQGQLSGTETVTGSTGTLEIEGAATDDTIDVSGFTNGLTQSVDGNGLISIDAGAGADTLTGGSTNNMFLAGAGADTINAGGGQDIIVGGTGGDSIVLTETTSAGDFVVYTALADWAGSVGAAGGTFSGYDVITGFTTGTDKLRFDSSLTAGDTTAAVGVIIAADDISASTAASTALNDLSAAEFTDVDAVLAYINDASILAAGGTFTYTNGADELLTVTDAASGTSAIYHVDSTDATITATEVSLVATVDAIVAAADIVIA